MGLLQELYSQFSPMAQALLNADGSIQDFDGNQIEPPDEGRAILYTKYSPFANKIINPDGSVTTILRITADAPIDGNTYGRIDGTWSIIPTSTDYENLSDEIETIENKIPPEATPSNQLADKNFVLGNVTSVGGDRGAVLNAYTGENTNILAPTITITSGGTGFSVGDSVNIFLENNTLLRAQLVVSSVDGSGAVTGFSISSQGAYSNPFDQDVFPATQYGQGLQLHISSTASVGTTLNNITNLNHGDTVTVIKDETAGNTTVKWMYADYNGDGLYNWVPVYKLNDASTGYMQLASGAGINNIAIFDNNGQVIDSITSITELIKWTDKTDDYSNGSSNKVASAMATLQLYNYLKNYTDTQISAIGTSLTYNEILNSDSTLDQVVFVSDFTGTPANTLHFYDSINQEGICVSDIYTDSDDQQVIKVRTKAMEARFETLPDSPRANTLLNSELENLQSEIDTEITNRTNANTNLQTQVTNNKIDYTTKIANLIKDNISATTSTYSSFKITQMFSGIGIQTLKAVANQGDLRDPATLTQPTYCYVNSTSTIWYNDGARTDFTFDTQTLCDEYFEENPELVVNGMTATIGEVGAYTYKQYTGASGSYDSSLWNIITSPPTSQWINTGGQFVDWDSFTTTLENYYTKLECDELFSEKEITENVFTADSTDLPTGQDYATGWIQKLGNRLKWLRARFNSDGKSLTSIQADSASKWTTARTISITGSQTGSVTFDGSANVTLQLTNVVSGGATGGARSSGATAMYDYYVVSNYFRKVCDFGIGYSSFIRFTYRNSFGAEIEGKFQGRGQSSTGSFDYATVHLNIEVKPTQQNMIGSFGVYVVWVSASNSSTGSAHMELWVMDGVDYRMGTLEVEYFGESLPTAVTMVTGNNQMASSCIPWSQTGNKRCGIIEGTTSSTAWQNLVSNYTITTVT